ncbi:site-specific integrase [Bacteroides sp. ET336]|uniref:tyrosine-type recombinase/integrase n=1 Tax=Bacteroides sp. ET336 TaxID=2972459 RepID=UPI0021AC135D|nr:site-specific integrase [Bacteroides sp. ET336]MCR8893471.1 site-specific integrase [Bacteroides sp. ET336]MDN0057968.1 tyrosine-type recombinase/integrase [Bacteroides caecigallinarum]
MFSSRKKSASIFSIISYTEPKLHTGKTWYIDFKSYDPVEQKMKRKKYMLDGIPKVTDRRRRANEIITNLNIKLRSGWNPWADVENSRQYTPYIDIMRRYHIYLEKLYAAGTIKENTIKDYEKRLRVFEEYTSKRIPAIVYAYQIDQSFISDFLDYVLLDRDSSARTRNNYRTWLSSVCNWMMEKQYLVKNPVENIRMLQEDEKKRSALSSADIQKLKKYLKKENQHFLFLCQFAYYTFIRPDEITNIKLSDIYLKEQKVFIASSISKNRKDGMVGLNDKLIKTMLDLDIFKNPGDYYLFGKGFKPSKEKVTTKVYRNYFNKVREKLKFPDSYQFYSLKDSGIRDLANAEGIVIARDQARHADVSTTNKYLKGTNMTVHEETKHFEGEF